MAVGLESSMLDRRTPASNDMASHFTGPGGSGKKAPIASVIPKVRQRGHSQPTAPAEPNSPKGPKADAPLQVAGRVTIATAHAAVLLAARENCHPMRLG